MDGAVLPWVKTGLRKESMGAKITLVLNKEIDQKQVYFLELIRIH